MTKYRHVKDLERVSCALVRIILVLYHLAQSIAHHPSHSSGNKGAREQGALCTRGLLLVTRWRPEGAGLKVLEKEHTELAYITDW